MFIFSPQNGCLYSWCKSSSPITQTLQPFSQVPPSVTPPCKICTAQQTDPCLRGLWATLAPFLFCFVLEPCLMVLRGYSWLLFLVMRRGPYGKLRIKPDPMLQGNPLYYPALWNACTPCISRTLLYLVLILLRLTPSSSHFLFPLQSVYRPSVYIHILDVMQLLNLIHKRQN